jgi:hypothetical protein
MGELQPRIDFDQCETRAIFMRVTLPEQEPGAALQHGRQQNQARQSARCLPTSHFWMTSATCMLFLSCIIMWPLLLMPISGRLIQSTVPPAALIALAYSVSIFLNVAQRGVFVVIEESAAPSRRASIRGQQWAA